MRESNTLTLSRNKTSLSTDYFTSIKMNTNSEIALVRLHMYNTIPNINETNNQMRIYTYIWRRRITLKSSEY